MPLYALSTHQPEDKRDDTRNDDAGGEGEIEGEVFFFDVDVAGEAAKPGEAVGERQDDADDGDDEAEDDEGFTDAGHIILPVNSEKAPDARLANPEE